jgi:uncharacterized phage-associated protein
MLPVSRVAEFIIQESDRISNLKLQKLLYYAQGWYLGLTGNPLFHEHIEAWVHGPVVPSMFRIYRKNGWNTIPKPEEPVSLPPLEARHIKSVLRAYGIYTADQLERLSHTERPWIDARKGLSPSEPSTATITHESMREFFASRAQA